MFAAANLYHLTILLILYWVPQAPCGGPGLSPAASFSEAGRGRLFLDNKKHVYPHVHKYSQFIPIPIP